MTDQDSCCDRTWRSLVEGIEGAVKAVQITREHADPIYLDLKTQYPA